MLSELSLENISFLATHLQLSTCTGTIVVTVRTDMKHQAQSWINLSLDVSQTAFTSKDPVSFLFPHAYFLLFFFLFWGCLDFFGIEFVLYLWVLLFAFLSKIVMWLHGMHKFFFEPCRMGGEELWRFGKSQPMH